MLAVQNPCPVAIDTLAIAKLDPLVWGERRHPTPVQSDDYRRPSEVDYARVIHSESFRRLQRKTQILRISHTDFHRIRLKHSPEDSQLNSDKQRLGTQGCKRCLLRR